MQRDEVCLRKKNSDQTRENEKRIPFREKLIKIEAKDSILSVNLLI